MTTIAVIAMRLVGESLFEQDDDGRSECPLHDPETIVPLSNDPPVNLPEVAG